MTLRDSDGLNVSRVCCVRGCPQAGVPGERLVLVSSRHQVVVQRMRDLFHHELGGPSIRTKDRGFVLDHVGQIFQDR